MATQELRAITGIELAVKDKQTVTADGDRIADAIAGVEVHRPRTQADIRGTLCEIHDERWGFSEAAVSLVKYKTIRAGHVSDWSVSLGEETRSFVASGTVRVTLYDGRRSSETSGRVNVFHLGDHERGLVRIPAGVYYAVRNVGDGPAAIVSLGESADDGAGRYRLASDSDEIPCRP
jgi:dTDP-4-dehydrorhamnose 3,5-epimerase